MRVCVLFAQTVTRLAGAGWWVVGGHLARHENVDPGNAEAGG